MNTKWKTSLKTYLLMNRTTNTHPLLTEIT